MSGDGNYMTIVLEEQREDENDRDCIWIIVVVELCEEGEEEEEDEEEEKRQKKKIYLSRVE